MTMPYACWFLWRAYYIEDFKWRLHFQFGVAFWRVKRYVNFEGPNRVWRALKTSILNTGGKALCHTPCMRSVHKLQNPICPNGICPRSVYFAIMSIFLTTEVLKVTKSKVQNLPFECWWTSYTLKMPLTRWPELALQCINDEWHHASDQCSMLT